MKFDIGKAAEAAIRLARAAGEIQRAKYETNVKVELKGSINLVTEVDVECERLITAALRGEFPEHNVVAEEGTDTSTGSGYTWYVDPLDGTTNYAHGVPVFGPSIALVKDGEPLAGAVYDPMRDEMFSAVKGEGAYLNGKRMKVSATARLEGAVLATGFPYEIKTLKANNMENFNRVAPQCRAIRRCGAAAIDLAWTARGRFDGFWEQYLYAWDMAAGALMVTEAGGVITDMKGNKLDLLGKHICAATPGIHANLLKLLEC